MFGLDAGVHNSAYDRPAPRNWRSGAKAAKRLVLES
jgi:hypothetical protein